MRIEMHCHTSNNSTCGKVTAEDMVRLHAKAGIDAVVLTDHFNEETVIRHPGSLKEKADRFLDSWRIAKEEGEKLGITIILGMESRLTCGKEDFLVYGIEEDFYFEHPGFYYYSQKEAYEACCEYGALFLQAHPFRSYCRPQDPRYLHGVETFNGNPRHENHNDLAKAWALENGILLHTSGSDFHQTMDLGAGGIIIDGTVKTGKELSNWLKNKPFIRIGE